MKLEFESAGLDARGLAKNRIEALADGIFAVAMTLLVLDIKSPNATTFATNRALIENLLALEHSFAMYVISFFVLAMFWVAHYILFHFIRYMDRRLLWTNLAFLLLAIPTFSPSRLHRLTRSAAVSRPGPPVDDQ